MRAIEGEFGGDEREKGPALTAGQGTPVPTYLKEVLQVGEYTADYHSGGWRLKIICIF